MLSTKNPVWGSWCSPSWYRKRNLYSLVSAGTTTVAQGKSPSCFPFLQRIALQELEAKVYLITRYNLPVPLKTWSLLKISLKKYFEVQMFAFSPQHSAWCDRREIWKYFLQQKIKLGVSICEPWWKMFLFRHMQKTTMCERWAKPCRFLRHSSKLLVLTSASQSISVLLILQTASSVLISLDMEGLLLTGWPKKRRCCRLAGRTGSATLSATPSHQHMPLPCFFSVWNHLLSHSTSATARGNGFCKQSWAL